MLTLPVILVGLLIILKGKLLGSLLSTSVAVSVVVIVPASLPLPFTFAATGASFTAVIVIVAVASFESALPSLALYLKLSLVVSLPSWV